ncbi:MAG TPA: hypothetical protein PKK12_12070 [Candidatus Aminicenantes bacterium]|nr:hypothetical protein [Candidatus Aminicenantes bacterium]
MGRSDGIGSRYFTVEHGTPGATGEDIAGNVQRNEAGTSGDGAMRRSPWKIPPASLVDVAQPLRVWRGYEGEVETVHPDRDGLVRISAMTGQLLTVEIDPDREGDFSGLERVVADSRPLPIGSCLDPYLGVFSWLPGPGYRGEFVLEFLAFRNGDSVMRHRVTIRLTEGNNDRHGPEVAPRPTAEP